MSRSKTPADGYYRHREVYNGVKIDIRSKDKRELNDKVRRKKNAIDSGDELNNKNISVETWAKEWLETYIKPTVIDKSYKLYKGNIKNHILPHIGSMHLTDVRAVHLQKILNLLAGKSESHVKHVKLAMTYMFREAHFNKYIAENPATNMMLPKVSKGSRRSLTDYERQIFFKVCETHYARLWALTAYYTGVRPQEAAALTWGDIDIANKRIVISKAVESGTRNISSTKTGAGDREIPIPQPLLELLKKENVNRDNGEPVFTIKTGNQCNVDNICVWWNNIRRCMDIEMGATVYRNKIIESKIDPKLTAYCLRHTYCTNLQRSGVPLNVAKYLMGHDDVTMTADIYAHQTDDQTEEARIKTDKLHAKDMKGECKKNNNAGSKVGSRRYRLVRTYNT